MHHDAFGILKELFLGVSLIDYCTSPVSLTIILQIHTESLLYVQLSFLRNIFCVISVDNKTRRGVQLHKIRFDLHVLRILEMGLRDVKFEKEIVGC